MKTDMMSLIQSEFQMLVSACAKGKLFFSCLAHLLVPS